MNKASIGCAVVVAVVLVIVLAGVLTYNRLIGLSQGVDQSWAQVQNVYQRRLDLIPNLVATVQGAANFEKSTLEAVTEARASVGKMQINANQATATAEQLAAFDKAQGQLGTALSRLMVVVERYPELRANANFMALQVQLEGTENRIAVERERFNDAVRSYNTGIQTIPGVFFAGMLGYGQKPYFVAAPGAQTVPSVQFNFGPTPVPAPR